MPLIAKVGRKALKVRCLIAMIYIALALGGITMLYPFILMISGSTKSNIDSPGIELIPAFMNNDNALYRKYIESLVNEKLDTVKSVYHSETPSFRDLKVPQNINKSLISDWRDYLKETELPYYTYGLGEMEAQRSKGVMPRLLRHFRSKLAKEFNDDIHQLNNKMDAEYVNWNAFFYNVNNYFSRRIKPGRRPLDEEFRKFKYKQPLGLKYFFSLDGFYSFIYLKNRYGGKIEEFNSKHNTNYSSWGDIHLTQKFPELEMDRKDWEIFVREIVSFFWLRIDKKAKPDYHDFLKAKYINIEIFNNSYGTEYQNFNQIPCNSEIPEDGIASSDWDAFIQGWKDPETDNIYKIDLRHITIKSVDFMFRDFLKRKYGSLQDLNSEYNTEFNSWLEIVPPQKQFHYEYFKENMTSIRKEFCVRNFITVFDYLVVHGRAVLNTFIYCALAIFTALIFNPLAAYALSRYKPPFTYQVLLFMMLTMAFPPLVTMIPRFLMLREFLMLNTFWALVLPGIANGFWIFLLKGFFDSLPQELYESAELDGASEIRIFFEITMKLSKPVLAVVALNAFTLAYSDFMMAMLICQDEKMWTLMPWLFQLQQRSGEGIVYASLLVSAIPTLIVFIFCQNIIMRGIVVPSEK